MRRDSISSFDENNEFKISTEYGPITFTPEILKDKLEKVVKDFSSDVASGKYPDKEHSYE